MPLFQHEDLLAWVSELLVAWGYEPADGRYIAETLVDANLRGVDSHGVLRLPAYHRRVTSGLVSPRAKPVVTINGGTARVDARGAAGQIAARSAVDTAASIASANGVGVVTVHGSAHLGAAGFYARSLALRGFLALVVSNSEPVVVPFGGRTPLVGTNPFAFAAPNRPFPLVVDMATSSVAMGKVMVAEAAGEEIPAGWGVDGEGNPTTDPSQIRALLPLGGAKGYGFGLMVEVLSGVLSGAAITSDIGHMYEDFKRPQNSGHLMLALDVRRFMALEEFLERMQLLSQRAHKTPPAPGFERVLLPGEPEQLTMDQRSRDGVPIPEGVISDLNALALACGVPPLGG